MSLRFGRPMVAIPGPSIVPDRVLQAMHRPMEDIYAGDLVEFGWGLVDRLAPIARTGGQPFILVSNGHGAWQMALSNTMSRGEKVLVAESGPFALRWADMATAAGIDVEILPGDERLPVDAEALEQRLREDSGHELKAVLAVHVDTGTSVRNDLPALRRAIDAAEHPALFMADCIGSLCCDRYEMDAWGVDVTVAASQKGLMMPPGLAFVWANDRALAAHESADLRDGYHDWGRRMNATMFYEVFAGTPPVPHLYGLREALTMLEEEGLEQAWARHQILADAVRAAVETWSTPGGIELNVTDPAARANAVTTIRTGSIDADRLRAVCDREAGLTLGLGIGSSGGSAFRIGHMGHLNPPMILGTLATVEAGLRAIGAPLGGSGAAAAAEVVARAMA